MSLFFSMIFLCFASFFVDVVILVLIIFVSAPWREKERVQKEIYRSTKSCVYVEQA